MPGEKKISNVNVALLIQLNTEIYHIHTILLFSGPTTVILFNAQFQEKTFLINILHEIKVYFFIFQSIGNNIH